MATKPSIPKGTRDFSPIEMAKRNYIFNTIRETFHKFGYQQIETPSMENLSTLMGKYGDEGDKLLFKIQNSGDYFSALTDEELLSRNAAKLASKFCEKGLRYDLTVPFARYVVMHRDEITFPFKRFHCIGSSKIFLMSSLKIGFIFPPIATQGSAHFPDTVTMLVKYKNPLVSLL